MKIILKNYDQQIDIVNIIQEILDTLDKSSYLLTALIYLTFLFLNFPPTELQPIFS